MFPFQAGQPFVSSHADPFGQVKLRLAMSLAYTAPPAMSAWLSINTFVRPVDLTAEQLSLIGGSNSAHIYMFDATPPATHNTHS